MVSAQNAQNVGRIVSALPRDCIAVVVKDGADVLVACEPVEVLSEVGPAAFSALEAATSGWWAGWLSYDLGRAVERVDASGAPSDIPDMWLARFDVRLRITPDGSVSFEGDGPARRKLQAALDSDAREAAPVSLNKWTSSLSHDQWCDGVNRILSHIADGNCYQVNLTRQLTSDTCDPVGLYAALQSRHDAPHAAFVRTPDIAVVSASPESFLRCDGDAIESRPIKGTAASAESLRNSKKDRAENVMIVDLARNDLGRVCVPGTVEVPELCAVESHPGLHHLVSTVTGRLTENVSSSEVLRATFPPASITGAPKPRVMQIIEDIEPVRRGVYCGAIGWIEPASRRMDFNVAIRTFTVHSDRTTFGVGGGIVADSQPEAEWRETELKAARLLEVASGQTSR